MSIDKSRRSGGFAGKIMPLRPTGDRRRADSIRDVVDAFTRLRGSVARFVETLARSRGVELSIDIKGSPSFSVLLSSLRSQAEQADFPRLSDLNAFIERAALAEALRDVIFQSPAVDQSVLREAAAALDRLDAAFIALCIGHVLERYAQSGAPAVSVV
ncbi:hypothetical protein N0A02_31545 [Paraburkholderia acidicola]|uniref:Uncharacterized protein n=1 Tax=Paraburkholderia acidicola TaxID=1912599 RepID=A0ABV1LXR0_9BURK